VNTSSTRSYAMGADTVGARQLLSKVPEITIYFWIIKVLCTTVGETVSDFLNVNLGFGLTGTSIVMGAMLLVVLFAQFKAKRYIPSIYWLTVVLISIFGTLVTDNMTDNVGIPLEVSTVVFSLALGLTFAIWYASEKTLSIHSIFTIRREAFYWLAILFTFALGTAAGDLMAESLGLGYLLTGAIVCGVIASVSVAWRFGLDPIVAFWTAYIMTRPLGGVGGGLSFTITDIRRIGARGNGDKRPLSGSDSAHGHLSFCDQAGCEYQTNSDGANGDAPRTGFRASCAGCGRPRTCIRGGILLAPHAAPTSSNGGGFADVTVGRCVELHGNRGRYVAPGECRRSGWCEVAR
jgi:uncharacterized membrane-anchored protein